MSTRLTGEILSNLPIEKPDYNRMTGRELDPNRHDQLPTYILWDNTILPQHQQIIRNAVNNFFNNTNLNSENNKLKFLGNWKSENPINKAGQIAAFESVEWNIKSSKTSDDKIDATKAVSYNMFVDPYQKQPQGIKHWEVLFTEKGLHCDGLNYVLGYSIPDLGTIISFNKIDEYFKKNPEYSDYYQEVATTIIEHELGHTVFNLPLKKRGVENLDSRFGGDHCKNEGCCMKQGMNIKDFLVITLDRKKETNPFCDECIDDIKSNPKKP